ncbi:MAG: histidine kinase, partial [Cyclobacteriaceae bacterium]|nr:histidine kinase [Cyclobacteriaceae bacterium]
PEVIVSTELSPSGGGQGEVIQISVKDNGSGVPLEIKDKIFQPFFTTKPTGSGTGLGLSLSYDIIKGHGGTLKIEKREEVGLPAGQAGSTFIILIPTI